MPNSKLHLEVEHELCVLLLFLQLNDQPDQRELLRGQFGSCKLPLSSCNWVVFVFLLNVSSAFVWYWELGLHIQLLFQHLPGREQPRNLCEFLSIAARAVEYNLGLSGFQTLFIMPEPKLHPEVEQELRVLLLLLQLHDRPDQCELL